MIGPTERDNVTMGELSSLLYRPSEITPPPYRIGLIGCGGITSRHLEVYRAAGLPVVAFSDIDVARATGRRDEFYPEAEVYADSAELLARDDIEVVDVATHVDVRPHLVSEALRAGKHVLSQKPFVSRLSDADELIATAATAGRRLAVNQNVRWAPHFAFLLAAVRAGVVGTVSSVDLDVFWPHDQWVRDLPAFATMPDLILYDFGVQWFDVIALLFADREATSVTAHVHRAAGQVIPTPSVGVATMLFADGDATLRLRGGSHYAESGGYRVDGDRGSIIHRGSSLGGSSATVVTDRGEEQVDVRGDWFAFGMHGTMTELLRAVAESRTPSNDARSVLPGLRLCFAAVESSHSGQPVDPRAVTELRLRPALLT